MDMEFILSFFNSDEKWYKETQDKIAKLESSLPKEEEEEWSEEEEIKREGEGGGESEADKARIS